MVPVINPTQTLKIYLKYIFMVLKKDAAICRTSTVQKSMEKMVHESRKNMTKIHLCLC